MSETPEIHGICATRFGAVKDAFAANFVDAPEGLNERGARFSVVIDGEVVVDLMGGWADTAQTVPYGPDTLTPVFSAGKAVMALLIARCVDRGLLDYASPVSAWWPAFGQAGKDRITLGQLMSHQAGLAGFTDGIDPTDWFDRETVLRKLCAQAPQWPPGSASGYHPITIGYLAGEVFRIVDGRTMGTALREDFPDLDLWIGLPESEHGRVAQMRKPARPPDLGPIDPIKRSAFFDRGSSPGQRESGEWKKAEIPSANLHGTARDLARIVNIVATGAFDGRRLLSETTRRALTRERIHGQDKVLPFVMGWAAGLTSNRGLNIFGPRPAAVGHYGWGGSCVMADPAAKLSASYVMTRQSPHLIGDPRAVRLLEAMYSAL